MASIPDGVQRTGENSPLHFDLTLITMKTGAAVYLHTRIQHHILPPEVPTRAAFVFRPQAKVVPKQNTVKVFK